jgi:hypothetical protein
MKSYSTVLSGEFGPFGHGDADDDDVASGRVAVTHG